MLLHGRSTVCWAVITATLCILLLVRVLRHPPRVQSGGLAFRGTRTEPLEEVI